MELSKFKFFSVGVVAENKALDTDNVEVSPVETLPLIDGEITDDAQELEVSSQNKDGKGYSSKILSTNTVNAKWLPVAGGNRVTSPDVRRGAVVMLYQMADEEKYYWTTLLNDSKLRKLETVIYAFSATQTEDADVNGDNYYYLEVSTHKKLITFHTSKANGEPFTYDIQINTEEGKIVIQDDDNNYFLLDSKEKQLRMENSDGNFFEIIGKDCNLNVVKDWNITVGGNVTRTVTGSVIETTEGSHNNTIDGTFAVDSGGNTLTAPVNTLDAASNVLNGNISVKAGNGASGSGTIEGSMEFEKDVSVDGTLTAQHIVTPTDIDAPNV